MSFDVNYVNGTLHKKHAFKNNFTSSLEEQPKTFEDNLYISEYDGNMTFYELDCYPFNAVMEISHSYYLPCIICVGFVGNILSCVVFLSTHLKMRSSSYYLAALACADLGFLFALLMVWLSSTLDVNLFHANGICQCIVYLSSVCGFLSVWLIVAFTVERFIAVQYPLHRPHMCTVARAKAIVMYLVIFAVVAHAYVFQTSGIITMADGVQQCEMLEGYRDIMQIINIIDSLLTLIIPLILIIAMNVMIAVNLFKFSQRFKRHEVNSTNCDRSDIKLKPLAQVNESLRENSINNNNSKSINGRRNPSQQSFHSSKSDNSSCQMHSWHTKTRSYAVPSTSAHSIHGGTGPGRGLISTRTQYSITKMLLLVSSVFILLNLPSYVIRVYVFVFNLIWSEGPSERLWCAQQMFMTLYYTNFSVNFLLYSMYGITFRRCLSQLVRSNIKWLSVHCRVTTTLS